MRILALVPGGIGEQILFFPTLEDLKTQYPNALIDVIVEPRAKIAYRVCPHVHEVLMFDYQDRNGLADYLNLLGMIRDREYDVAFTLDKRWTLGLLFWLNGIPLSIGYQTSTAWFLSNPVPQKTEQYTAYMYHDLIQGLGIQTPCPPLKIAVPKDDISWAEGEQKRLLLQESGYILLYGGFGESYPVPQWSNIINNMQQKQPSIPIVLLQWAGNEAWVKMVQESCPNLKVIKPSGVGRLAAMIAGANLMVCTDSTPLQLAVAVGTYTVALFGQTKATKRLPPSQDKYIGIQSATYNLGDIQATTVLEKIWRS
ncbi:glycosyltransferase family 9 protein [Crocosphaera sp. XPORK-15E]|uniref:glycosyltransferase family 9 protein n=1 Tax=Crocosphaera sp. XPORK-15E TaxID=3110247 RepID=UPI002B219AF8|nr:glycosyltransferase family 9 protein [Crocosphaera sp. XPORK-15E]MEA5535241.1 glycosyltransferase family 9 protein [Crocosphaera sp. XPORK-15E]